MSGNMREGERILDGTIDFEPVEEDEEKIPAAQEESISNFDEITEIPNPPTTGTPTRHSKRLSEKRGGHNYQSGQKLSRIKEKGVAC